ncbi:hypothetical protein TNIN_496861 [Trichonephila inaurata madagascariensis]|uniref:Uncharacterized protein n=1 Tax=Trichonephila inaurata madagascariensis TaxID=2747483 RepID=A0A8X7C8N2_9ARAC|nr:hypothetical protein TNIN_496861 [Trichonephila inaurata madagascariensis]
MEEKPATLRSGPFPAFRSFRCTNRLRVRDPCRVDLVPVYFRSGAPTPRGVSAAPLPIVSRSGILQFRCTTLVHRNAVHYKDWVDGVSRLRRAVPVGGGRGAPFCLETVLPYIGETRLRRCNALHRRLVRSFKRCTGGCALPRPAIALVGPSSSARDGYLVPDRMSHWIEGRNGPRGVGPGRAGRTRPTLPRYVKQFTSSSVTAPEVLPLGGISPISAHATLPSSEGPVERNLCIVLHRTRPSVSGWDGRPTRVLPLGGIPPI